MTVEVKEEDGAPVLTTNLYDFITDFNCPLITTQTLGMAFEPEQRFENNDGSDIIFDTDYLGDHRGLSVLPGPFATPIKKVKV